MMEGEGETNSQYSPESSEGKGSIFEAVEDCDRCTHRVKTEVDITATVFKENQERLMSWIHGSNARKPDVFVTMINRICDHTDSNSAEDQNGKKEQLATTVLNHLESLAETCGQLMKLGVEIGMMLFEDHSVWCCGSSRLKRIAMHPQLSVILSEMTSTEAEGQSVEEWTVVNLLTSSSSRLTMPHHSGGTSGPHRSPHSPVNQTACLDSAEHSDTCSFSSFQTNTNSSPSSVSGSWTQRPMAKEVAAYEPLTMTYAGEHQPRTSTCTSGNQSLTLTQAIKDEPVTLTSENEPLTSTCVNEGQSTFTIESKPLTMICTNEGNSATVTCASEGESEESMSQDEDNPSDDYNVNSDNLSALDVRFIGNNSRDVESGSSDSTKDAVVADPAACFKEWQQQMVMYILGKGPKPSNSLKSSVSSSTMVTSHSNLRASREWQQMMVRYILGSSPQAPDPLTPDPAISLDSTSTSPASTAIARDITSTTTTTTTSTTITPTTTPISSPPSTTTLTMECESAADFDASSSNQSSSVTNSVSLLTAKTNSRSAKSWQNMMVSYILGSSPQAPDPLTSVTPIPSSSLCDTSQPAMDCAVAGVSFTDQSGSLDSSQSDPVEHQHRCGKCRINFPTQGKLRSHRLDVHSSVVKVFPCSLCSKRFISQRLLDMHLRRHLGLKPFQCEQCGYRCSEKCNLQVHMRIHTGEKPYSCDVCGEAFRVQCALTVHHRLHTGEEPFLCEFCGKGFRQGGRLNVHRRMHNGEKPFGCDNCAKAFMTRKELTIHERVHTGIEPHTCQFCGKAFKMGKHLTIHLRLHTGERPFSCHICGERFHRNDLLAIHVKKHAPSSEKKKPLTSSSDKEKS